MTITKIDWVPSGKGCPICKGESEMILIMQEQRLVCLNCGHVEAKA